MGGRHWRMTHPDAVGGIVEVVYSHDGCCEYDGQEVTRVSYVRNGAYDVPLVHCLASNVALRMVEVRPKT